MAELSARYPQVKDLKEVMNEFVANTLLNKPDDVYNFAQSYFAAFHPASAPAKKAKPVPVAISGPSGVGKGTRECASAGGVCCSLCTKESPFQACTARAMVAC